MERREQEGRDRAEEGTRERGRGKRGGGDRGWPETEGKGRAPMTYWHVALQCLNPAQAFSGSVCLKLIRHMVNSVDKQQVLL